MEYKSNIDLGHSRDIFTMKCTWKNLNILIDADVKHDKIQYIASMEGVLYSHRRVIPSKVCWEYSWDISRVITTLLQHLNYCDYFLPDWVPKLS